MRARVVVPVQFVPNLVAALQEHMRVFSESYSNVGWSTEGHPCTRDLKSAAKTTRRIIETLADAASRTLIPELHYRDAFELLVGDDPCPRSRPTRA